MGSILSGPLPPREVWEACPPPKTPMSRALRDVLEKELEPLIGPKPGESKEEAEDRFYEYMKGGPCKQAFITVWQDCMENGPNPSYETAIFHQTMFRCLYSHPDYYQPFLTVVDASEKHVANELNDRKKASERN